MLGTNDLLLGFDAEDTAEQMGCFLKALHQAIPESRVLLIAPPPSEMIPDGCEADFSRLAELLSKVAAEQNVGFADAAEWSIEMACDGVHFSPDGHRRFAECAADRIRLMTK